MALQVTGLKREFKFGDKNLPDPNYAMTPEEVRKFYAGQYPELTNANLSGPNIEAGKAVYTLDTEVGTKG